MSGGEKQRVAIARALVMEPSLILADEPTGNLDQKVGTEIMNLLVELNREQGATIILITHDMEIARKCPRVVSIRDGKIVEDILS
jgi:putative ABC transport system ATP-binding protein